MRKGKGYRGWTWEILIGNTWELCYLVALTKAQLLAEEKPSPEARPVCVYIMRNADRKKP
jgi:hypothetical protein